MARSLVPAYFLRRRLVLATAFATSLLGLFLWLRHVFQDLDDELGLSLTARLESTSYIPFQIPPLPISPPPRSPLRPVRDLRASCLDAYFRLGEQCLGDQVDPLDILWTWVNGSDFLLVEAKELAQSQYDSNDPYRPVKSGTQARLYRCVSRIASCVDIDASTQRPRRAPLLNSLRHRQLQVARLAFPPPHDRLLHP